ncbi:elongation factor P [endosymbiont of Sipalinus gigas]|uniref:hypothetical protein n=1 Tax=endosymbiont of Sipalinus gigas TaxID=1972134 RepID=UPI000DC6F774|nr:hypothetical protein [endosymbiont of Sipalinus gigas]BBA85185.1 elongation factor P [endosymbiont of Sipalinus gigas]
MKNSIRNILIDNLNIGDKIIYNDEPFIVIKNEFIKSGKGLSFNRIRIKNIISNKILDKVFKSKDNIKKAYIIEKSCFFLYRVKNIFFFISCEDESHIKIDINLIKNKYIFIFKKINYKLIFLNKIFINIIIPKIINFKVINIICVNNNYVLSDLGNNLMIKSPLFIKSGDIIRVNIEKKEYISKVKNNL